MRASVLRSLGKGGHASAGSAEDTKGTTAVKPWGSTMNPLIGSYSSRQILLTLLPAEWYDLKSFPLISQKFLNDCGAVPPFKGNGVSGSLKYTADTGRSAVL